MLFQLVNTYHNIKMDLYFQNNVGGLLVHAGVFMVIKRLLNQRLTISVPILPFVAKPDGSLAISIHFDAIAEEHAIVSSV